MLRAAILALVAILHFLLLRQSLGAAPPDEANVPWVFGWPSAVAAVGYFGAMNFQATPRLWLRLLLTVATTALSLLFAIVTLAFLYR